jgi:hypothetical protein
MGQLYRIFNLIQFSLRTLMRRSAYKKEGGFTMSTRYILCATICLSVFLGLCSAATAQSVPTDTELNNKIRQEKFDVVLPQVMREYNVDMWIHVMRTGIPDSFGAENFGSTSGVFVFTDRGGDRIERAVLGRRWGATQRERGQGSKLVEESGVYDIIADPVFVGEPLSSPMTEYDYRFKGLREFVEARDPKRIAVNYRETLGTWPTSPSSRTNDGISHIDYLLLSKELGDEYASRLVSSEYLIMGYGISPVPSEIELLKKLRRDEVERVNKALAAVVPGVTRSRDAGLTTFRRMRTGQSQRGRSAGWENSVVQGGDILAAPSQGIYAYVLREGEKEPPSEIKRLWAEYLKIKKILVETIKAGLTPREIIQNYKRRYEEEGIIVREPQLHMVQPKNDFPVYAAGFDPEKTHLSIDCHGKGKSSQARKHDIYMGPRIGSYGPDWTFDVPLAPNHHFVLEYFFYMPSPTSNKDEDQYLFWWDHEQAIATESGVEYLYPLQEELHLIK